MDTTAKQQVVERIKQAQNVLVTVSKDPSVDQLAACIGLTLLLNKLGKHATAVFSGKIPSTIEFLQPGKTIEKNTDSLQDFIISLDKNKADKLRYKVEDDVVRIFITPYRTKISQSDLVFGQGDFNVEAVVALGVKDQVQLDTAITSHGRILHDATVISVNSGEGKAPALGQINWQEPTASSLSEMLVSISESFGTNLLDGQMATAFLTGIVAETNRFGNAKTSPKVMTMSAQLMAAGANQQLIVSKLEPPQKLPEAPKQTPKAPVDGTLLVEHDQPKAIKDDNTPTPVGEEAKLKGSQESSAEINIDQEGNIQIPGPLATEDQPEPAVEDIPEETPPEEPVKEPEDKSPAESDEMPKPVVEDEPEKSEKAEEERPKKADKVEPKETEEDLMPGGHHFMQSPHAGPTDEPPFSASTQSSWETSESTDPMAEPDVVPEFLTHGKDIQPKDGKDGEEEKPHLDRARDAVENAFATTPFDPAGSPVEALNSQPLPDVRPPEANAEDTIEPPAPPKVPPPIITPTPGVVIPSPFTSNNQKKIDEQTL